MKAGQRRLTAGEIDLARQAFGDALPYRKLRFVNGAAGNPIAKMAFRNGNGAITLRRTIYFQPVYYQPDFAAAKSAARGLLIHELTHVWQYARLSVPLFLARYGLEFTGCGFKAGRMYDYRAGVDRFGKSRLEAQAQMAGDYMTALIEGDEARQAKLKVSLSGSGLYGL